MPKIILNTEEKTLRDWENEEKEEALEDARYAISQAQRRNLDIFDPSIIPLFYGIRSADAYCESGGIVLPYGNNIIFPIFPYLTKNIFLNAYQGHSPQDIADSTFVIPIIQRPTEYKDLDYLLPILKKRPPSYFIRGNIIWGVIVGDDPDWIFKEPKNRISPSFKALHTNALNSNWIKRVHKYPETWEPYLWLGHNRGEKGLQDSFAFKYAQSSFFLGQKTVDAILEMVPQKEAFAWLTHTHMIIDHPVTHGLLSKMAIVDESTNYWKVARRFYDKFSPRHINLHKKAHIFLPKKPITTKDYEKLRQAGLPDIYAHFYNIDLSLSNIEETRVQVERNLQISNDAIAIIFQKGQLQGS